jgi:hypothetical protein
MATARETAQRHGSDVVAGNMGGVIADFTPEALTEFQAYGVMPPMPTKQAEILSEREDGGRHVFEIHYSNDAAALTIRSWWEDQNGTWKLVKAEPVR